MTSKNPFPLNKEELLKCYRTMRTIREFEERLHVDFSRGDIPGFVHLYAGEEAAATGIMQHLGSSDRIASTHRGHGHCIAKGVDVVSMMKEIYGKKGEVAISFVGDGASNQGTFLESLNLAAVWNLPALFVVENNGYAESTSRDYATAVDSYVDRAAGFGMPGITVDGTDFFAVYEAAGEIIQRAREGGGPSLLECKMVRFYGHFEGDAQTYRGKGELDDIRANHDCLKKFAAQVTGAGVISAAELQAIDQQVLAAIEDAVKQAKAAPLPTLADLTSDVYISY